MGDEKKTEDFASGPAVTAPDGWKGNCPRRDMASPGPAKPAGALRASVKPRVTCRRCPKAEGVPAAAGAVPDGLFGGLRAADPVFRRNRSLPSPGWWGMGSMACFAAAGWIVYKPETHYRLSRFRLDDQGKPASAGPFPALFHSRPADRGRVCLVVPRHLEALKNRPRALRPADGFLVCHTSI